LPKFTDAAKQNAVQFLPELDSYFALRRVPETLKLQIVNRAISDKYVIQWLGSVRMDLRTYDFMKAFTDLLWNSAVQAEVRNAIYLDKYDKQSGESYSAHFLEHSACATYLSPRMSEIDLITAISNHFPVHITRSILSANVTKKMR
jgi:hypothetical protein